MAAPVAWSLVEEAFCEIALVDDDVVEEACVVVAVVALVALIAELLDPTLAEELAAELELAGALEELGFDWPPTLTVIPIPALASERPLSDWNCFTSNVSPSAGSFSCVICFLAGFVYIRNVYFLLSPVSPKAPGALYSSSAWS